MNPRSLFGAIGIAAMVASMAAAAGAQAAPPYYPVPPPNGGYRQQSATNVAMMSERVGHMIAHLEADGRDYSGHRVNAIHFLQNAQGELNAAAQFAAANGYAIQVPPQARRGGVGERPPLTGETQMVHAQQNLERMTAHLQRDSHDFGGHRVAAVDLMRRANAELVAAIQFAQAHAYAP
jgi:hypothetical protein